MTDRLVTDVEVDAPRQVKRPSVVTPLANYGERRIAAAEPRGVVVTGRARPPCIPTVVVDRNTVFRTGLVHMLADSRFRVLSACANLTDLPQNVLKRSHCLAIISLDEDHRMLLPEIAELRGRHQQLGIIFLSDHFTLEELTTAIEIGGDCYLLKDEITPAALLGSLELVLLGGVVISKACKSTLRSWPQHQEPAPRACLENLEPSGDCPPRLPPIEPREQDMRFSNREQVILTRLMRGASNKEIARALEIAEATVKVHVKSLLRKIRVKNRTQAAMWAMNHLHREAELE